jgi:DNA polymerase-1
LRRVLLFDGLNALIRNWAVCPQLDVNGNHVGGLVGTLRTVKACVREFKPDLAVMCWDGKGGSTKRRSIYSDYKAGRKPRVNRHYDFETVEDSKANLRMQFLKTQEYLTLLGVPQIEIEGVEADDVIAYCCMVLEGTERIVVSTDKDFLQLVSPGVSVWSPTKRLMYTEPRVKEEFGVIPQNFALLKSLIGDGSDNIPGIKGMGTKTVAKLFPFLAEREATLDEVISHAEAGDPKNAKLRAVVEGRELLTENLSLMQLSSPIIGAHAGRLIRLSLEQVPAPASSPEVRMALLRDGVQFPDSDLFSVFRELSLRSRPRESTETPES